MQRQKIEFGTDGIRGIAGEFPLDMPTVRIVGLAIGSWLNAASSQHGRPRVLLARDTRASGPTLRHTLSHALLDSGIDVTDIGVMTTPGACFVTRHDKFDLGIVISASHNPYEQNGVKLIGPDGFKLSDDAEREIERLIAAAGAADAPQEPASLGHFDERDIRPQYLAHLCEGLSEVTLQGISVVIDCANGAGSAIAGEAFERLGVSALLTVNAEPNGTNINAQAGSEYVRRNRQPLLDLIKANGADLGLALDGDADRVVFVTPDGLLVDGDHLLGIFALDWKANGRLRGDTVVATDMSNSGLEHFLAAYDIKVSRTKVGDRYVMDRLRDGGFAVGGEQAGHVILLDENHTAGDGIYVGLLVAAMMARNKITGGPTLHQLAAQIPRYPQVIASATLLRKVDLSGVSGLDDLRREALTAFGNQGRVNIRFSGTEPNLLRAMVEGGPQTSMDEVVKWARRLCQFVGKAADTVQPSIDIVDCVTGAPVAGQPSGEEAI